MNSTDDRLPLSSLPETFPRWARWAILRWALWAAAVVASFAWLERVGMRSRDDEDPTLTGVISRYVPGWLWFAAIGGAKGWFDWHFSRAYESWRTSKPDVPR